MESAKLNAALLQASFEYQLTEQEEALLDRLEAEWLAQCRANQLEDFDWWTVSV
jgi:hypothetical protein